MWPKSSDNRMKDIIRNAFIEILSGIAEYHEDGGVINKDEYDNIITISFPDNNPNKAVVKCYWENGNKRREMEYYQGKQHGKDLSWHESGNKNWEIEYYQGKQHGKYLGWYENENKHWEIEYCQGKLHGKYIRWHENGSKRWEEEYYKGQKYGKDLYLDKDNDKY